MFGTLPGVTHDPASRTSDLFDRFVTRPRDTRGPYGWGRVAAGFAVVGILGMGLVVVVGVALAMFTPEQGGPSPVVMVGQLAGVAVWVPVVWLAARTLFSMRLGDLMSVLPGVRWGLFAQALGIAVVGFGAYAVYIHARSGTPLVALTVPVVLGVVAAVVLIPLQALAEELVFRGFGPQMVLGKIGTSRVATAAVFAVASALFASFHAASNAITWFVFFVFGLVFVALVRVTGGIEAAWALHAVNNVFFVVGGILRGQDLTAKQTDVTVGFDVFVQMGVMVAVAAVVALVARGRRAADPAR